MKIAVGNDVPGFALAQAVKEHVREKGHDVIDCGIFDIKNPKMYLIPADEVAAAVQKGMADFGILICGTGQGMAIAANKHRGVYAACVDSVFAAQRCRMINNANVMTIGAWITGSYLACVMVDAFLSTDFTQDLDARADYLKECLAELKLREETHYK